MERVCSCVSLYFSFLFKKTIRQNVINSAVSIFRSFFKFFGHFNKFPDSRLIFEGLSTHLALKIQLLIF